ncbi:MAG: PAS domain S-box protein [Nitrospirota bacterium]|nr:PAS domain S-box protein [Nitrospirota bacterium]
MKKKRIVIVEDEALIAMELERQLAGLGYEVCGSAVTADGAIGLVEARDPDLVLMDIRLRGEGDGIEAAAEIRRRFDIPVIFLTAYADDGTIFRVRQAAPFGYILKPYREEDLRLAIEVALVKHDGERQLRAQNESLEARVRERTAELGRAVDALKGEIAERTQAVERLRKSEERYRFLFEAIPIAVGMASLDGQALLANKASLDLYGMSREDQQGMNLRDLYANSAERSELMRQLQESGRVRDREVSLQRMDGAGITVLLNMDIVEMDGQKVILTTQRDITERRKAETALRERVKELTCQYAVRLDMQKDLSADEFCTRVVNHVVAAMQFPELCAAELELEGQRCFAGHRAERQSRELYGDIKSGDKVIGRLRVWCVDDRPFMMPEEQHLISAVADMVRQWHAFQKAQKEIEHLASFPTLNPNPVLEIDETGQVVFRNNAAAEILAQAGSADHRLFFPQDMQSLLASLPREPVCREVAFGGRVFQETIHALPELNTLRIYAADITELKLLDEALARSKREFESIFASMNDAAIFADSRRRIVRMNRAAEEMFGWRHEELEGKTTECLYAERSDYDALGRSRYNVAARRDRAFFEMRYRRKDGSVFPAESFGTQVPDADGGVMGFLGIHRDITARKEAEEQLARYQAELEEMVKSRTRELQDTVTRLQEEISRREIVSRDLNRNKLFLTNILNSIQDGICVFDRERRIMLVNNTIAKWIPGVGSLGFRTHTCAELFHSFGRCDVCAADYSEEFSGKRSLIFASGDENEKKWFEVHTFPLITNDDKHVGRVEYFRDITAAKDLESKIAGYQEQLRALNYEMADVVNREQRRIAQELHDTIPQTLLFCRMRLERIEKRDTAEGRRSGQSSDFREIYQFLDDAIEQSRNLMFKLAPPMLYELGLEPALQSLLDQFGREHPIAFRFKGRELKAPLQGDGAAMVYGMVRELLVNCVKHSEATHVEVAVNRRDGGLVVAVRDNGKGREAGAQAGNTEKGFGLFSIRERVRYLDGDFTIDTAPGKGFCATIRIALEKLRK